VSPPCFVMAGLMRITRVLRGSGTMGRDHVVILGTGWGGMRMVQSLDPKKYQISVVSPRNHMLFTPMLASAAVGTVSCDAVCEPVRPWVAKNGGRYYEASAEQVDTEKRTVKCHTGADEDFTLSYDRLIVAVGYQANTFGIPGADKYAMFMKETADGMKLREQILRRLEEASTYHIMDGDMNLTEAEKDHMRKILTFVIVGGGPTGVELCGELTDFLSQDVARQYPHLKDLVSVHMITDVVLGMFDKAMSDYAIDNLSKKQNVKLHLDAMVSEVTKTDLTLKSGMKIDYGTLVWCAGVGAGPFVRNVNLPKTPNGKAILTDGYMRVQGFEDIYALGDCASVNGGRLPPTAQVAKQQAIYLANNMNSGQPVSQWKEFQFQSLGMMAYVGGNKAIMDSPIGAKFYGMLGWLSWRSAYWTMQLSVRNRFLLSTDWSRTILFGRDLTRHGNPSRPQ